MLRGTLPAKPIVSHQPGTHSVKRKRIPIPYRKHLPEDTYKTVSFSPSDERLIQQAMQLDRHSTRRMPNEMVVKRLLAPLSALDQRQASFKTARVSKVTFIRRSNGVEYSSIPEGEDRRDFLRQHSEFKSVSDSGHHSETLHKGAALIRERVSVLLRTDSLTFDDYITLLGDSRSLLERVDLGHKLLGVEPVESGHVTSRINNDAFKQMPQVEQERIVSMMGAVKYPFNLNPQGETVISYQCDQVPEKEKVSITRALQTYASLFNIKFEETHEPTVLTRSGFLKWDTPVTLPPLTFVIGTEHHYAAGTFGSHSGHEFDGKTFSFNTKHEIRFNKGASVGTVLHEVGHLLGMDDITLASSRFNETDWSSSADSLMSYTDLVTEESWTFGNNTYRLKMSSRLSDGITPLDVNAFSIMYGRRKEQGASFNLSNQSIAPGVISATHLEVPLRGNGKSLSFSPRHVAPGCTLVTPRSITDVWIDLGKQACGHSEFRQLLTPTTAVSGRPEVIFAGATATGKIDIELARLNLATLVMDGEGAVELVFTTQPPHRIVCGDVSFRESRRVMQCGRTRVQLPVGQLERTSEGVEAVRGYGSVALVGILLLGVFLRALFGRGKV